MEPRESRGDLTVLQEISVEDFVLLDQLDLRLPPGLNVITGETGAGKSLLVDALGVATGARALTDYVRAGSQSAHVTAVFRVDGCPPALQWLKEQGIRPQEGAVVLSRDIYRQGPSSARVNGRPVTAAQLGQLSGMLLEVHGQSEGQLLMRPSHQRQLLDRFGGADLVYLAGRVKEEFERLEELLRERERVGGDEAERARRIDWLSYEIEEIKGAGLEEGEEQELLARRKILSNLEQLRSLAAQSYSLLRGDETDPGSLSVLEGLGSAAESLERASDVDEALAPWSRSLAEASVTLEEAALEIRRYLEDLPLDPEELDRVETRLSEISDLKRKYGGSERAILQHLDSVQREKAELERAESRAGELEEEIEAQRIKLGGLAKELSGERKEAAVRLTRAVREELAALNMEKARLEVEFSSTPDDGGVPVGDRRLAVGPAGVDRLELVLAANPGEPPRPLARTASGGELARIMLALKTVLSEVDGVPAVIFDEIDAGVGGVTARRVAERLAQLSLRRQVLCVTHLPSIAAMAGGHFAISKMESDGTSSTHIQKLEGQERVEELARMMAAGTGRAVREHAQELLKEAAEFRASVRGRSHRG